MSKLSISLAILAVLQITLVAATLPHDYQARSAREKQNLLWNQITWDEYPKGVLPKGGHSALSMASLILPTYFPQAFNRESDELAEGRLKLLHPYGSCGKANFEIFENSIYTGVLKAGSVSQAIIRPSVAKWDPESLAPGLGVKILIDGQRSQNFHTLFTPAGQGSNSNFLYNTVSNTFEFEMPSGPAAVIVRSMQAGMLLLSGGAEGRPEGVNLLGLYEQSSVENNGRAVPAGSVVAPWKIDFMPNRDLGVPDDSLDDFRVQLSRVPVGVNLYNIVAHRTQANWRSGVEGDLIGRIVLTSPLVTSSYCDNTLLLQHAAKPYAAN